MKTKQDRGNGVPLIQNLVDPFLAVITWVISSITLSVSHHCGGILAHDSFQHLFSSLRSLGLFMHDFLKLQPQNCNWADVWTLTGLLWHRHPLIFQYDVHLLAYFRSYSCCVTQFQPSSGCPTGDLIFACRILCYTEKFMADSMTPRHPGPVAATQLEFITSLLYCGEKVLPLKRLALVWELGVEARQLYFGLFCPCSITPEWLQVQFCRPLLVFLLAALPNIPY